MLTRVIIGALGGFAAALSKILALDTQTLAMLLAYQDFVAAQDLRVMVFIHTPILVLLGSLVAYMAEETVRMKIFAIGISAPAIIAPWLASVPPVAQEQEPKRAGLFEVIVPSAYAQSAEIEDRASRLDALKYLFTGKVESPKRFWVIVGSYQDLEEAREQVERINDDDPQLQAFVGQRQEDNPYYPVIVGGEDAYLPLDEARQLQNGVERTGLVKESYLSSYENRLPPIAPSE